MKPPSRSDKTRPEVWAEQSKGLDWQKYIRATIDKGPSTRGNCKKTTYTTCGKHSDCKSDPDNPCKGKCACDYEGINECVCIVPGYVGENPIWRSSYNLKH